MFGLLSDIVDAAVDTAVKLPGAVVGTVAEVAVRTPEVAIRTVKGAVDGVERGVAAVEKSLDD
jgi:hypothetical protein